METIEYQKISEKIKQLPDFLLQEISDYIDFLLYKNEKDWYTSLNDEQKAIIEQGKNDILQGKTHRHQDVVREMNAYIKSKEK